VGCVRFIQYLAVWSVEPLVIKHAGLKAQVNVMYDRYKLVIVFFTGVMQGSWRTFSGFHHMQGVHCMW